MVKDESSRFHAFRDKRANCLEHCESLTLTRIEAFTDKYFLNHDGSPLPCLQGFDAITGSEKGNDLAQYLQKKTQINTLLFFVGHTLPANQQTFPFLETLIMEKFVKF